MKRKRFAPEKIISMLRVEYWGRPLDYWLTIIYLGDVHKFISCFEKTTGSGLHS